MGRSMVYSGDNRCCFAGRSSTRPPICRHCQPCIYVWQLLKHMQRRRGDLCGPVFGVTAGPAPVTALIGVDLDARATGTKQTLIAALRQAYGATSHETPNNTLAVSEHVCICRRSAQLSVRQYGLNMSSLIKLYNIRNRPAGSRLLLNMPGQGHLCRSWVVRCTLMWHDLHYARVSGRWRGLAQVQDVPGLAGPCGSCSNNSTTTAAAAGMPQTHRKIYRVPLIVPDKKPVTLIGPAR